MTSLSRTFSLIPHCCPQKQQWVLTSLSGSYRASAARSRREMRPKNVVDAQLVNWKFGHPVSPARWSTPPPAPNRKERDDIVDMSADNEVRRVRT